mgnify:CR=1 FL=1
MPENAARSFEIEENQAREAQNRPKSTVLSGFGALFQLPDAPAAPIVAESQMLTRSHTRSYTYFEIVSGPGPSRQLLGGIGRFSVGAQIQGARLL